MFRQLSDDHGKPLSKNVRPTQHEHDRIVTYSGPEQKTSELPLVFPIYNPAAFAYYPFFPQNVPFMLLY
jgi:carbonic anhydrase